MTPAQRVIAEAATRAAFRRLSDGDPMAPAEQGTAEFYFERGMQTGAWLSETLKGVECDGYGTIARAAAERAMKAEW